MGDLMRARTSKSVNSNSSQIEGIENEPSRKASVKREMSLFSGRVGIFVVELGSVGCGLVCVASCVAIIVFPLFL